MTELVVENQSLVAVCHVVARRGGDPASERQLESGQPLETGERASLLLPDGLWDLRVEDCDGAVLWTQSVRLAGGPVTLAVRVTDVDPVGRRRLRRMATGGEVRPGATQRRILGDPRRHAAEALTLRAKSSPDLP